MLRAKDISDRFIREGAKRRLAELDAEREMLMQILNGSKPVKKLKKKRNQSAKHWTQTSAGRARMSKLMKDKYASGWKARQPKDVTIHIPSIETPQTDDQSTH